MSADEQSSNGVAGAPSVLRARWRRSRRLATAQWTYWPLGLVAALLHGGERAILVWYGIGAVATVAYCTFGARCPQCRKNLIGRLLAKPYNDELKKRFDCPRCGLDVGALEKAPVESRSEQEARG